MASFSYLLKVLSIGGKKVVEEIKFLLFSIHTGLNLVFKLK